MDLILKVSALVVAMAAKYSLVAVLWWAVCWGFGLVWSWKTAVGVWAVVQLGSMAVAPMKAKGADDGRSNETL